MALIVLVLCKKLKIDPTYFMIGLVVMSNRAARPSRSVAYPRAKAGDPEPDCSAGWRTGNASRHTPSQPPGQQPTA